MRGKPVRIADFSKGLILNQDEASLPLGAASALNDVEPMLGGGLKSRPGLTPYAQPASTGVNLTYGLDIAAFFASGGTYNAPAGTILNASAGTTLASGLDTTRHWIFLEAPVSGALGPIYAMNGIDTPRYITAVGAIGNWVATTGTVPNGTAMAYAGNRVWVARGETATLQSRLYFSDLGNPLSWTSTNYVDIDPYSGGGITAIATAGPYLLVFKKRAIYVVYDLNTGANRKLTGAFGVRYWPTLPGGVAVTTGPDGVYFADPTRGLCVCDGSTVRPLGDAVLGPANIISIAASTRYVFALTTAYLYVFDRQLDSWWRHTMLGQSIIAPPANFIAETLKIMMTSGSYKLLDFSPSHNTSVLNATGSDFDALTQTQILAVWESGAMDFDQPLRKRLRYVELEGRSVDNTPTAKALNLSVAINGGSYATAKALDFGITAGYGEAQANGLGVGHSFKVKLSTRTGLGNYGWQVHAMSSWAQARRDA